MGQYLTDLHVKLDDEKWSHFNPRLRILTKPFVYLTDQDELICALPDWCSNFATVKWRLLRILISPEDIAEAAVIHDVVCNEHKQVPEYMRHRCFDATQSDIKAWIRDIPRMENHLFKQVYKVMASNGHRKFISQKRSIEIFKECMFDMKRQPPVWRCRIAAWCVNNFGPHWTEFTHLLG